MLLLCLALPATLSVAAQQSSPTTGTDTPPAVKVVQDVGPAVVTVINEQTVQSFGAPTAELQPAGAGTGFIIDTDGHIVTNWHVVDGGEQFLVIFADGTSTDAELIGSDPISDLAVVQVKGDVPATVSFGDSSALLPGQPVLAIGSPLGTFSNTVTEGIVSAVGRNFPQAGNQGPQVYTNLIQHDAAINAGNSGGPLLNMQGEVIGVNTLGIPSENGQPVQGLFFAIPSNEVKEITSELIENGKVVYPFVGVSYLPITPTAAAQAGLDVDYGIYVAEVEPGSPADDAGIKADDVILEIGGTKIDATNTFPVLLFQHKPGDEVEMVIHRNGKDSTVTVTLGERS
jgi:2-alkenal reductase